MTAYLLTPEQHAQIVKILSDASWHIPEGSALDRDAEAALAMLKAMKPVEPCANQYKNENDFDIGPPSEQDLANGWIPLYKFGEIK